MKGMFKPLWHTFCIVVIAYSAYRMPKTVIEIAFAVFIGGTVALTVFAYLAARTSMPRKAAEYLPKR